MKSYRKYLSDKRHDTQPPISYPSSVSKTYACPLVKPDLFGIKSTHQIRCDCDGTVLNRYNLLKHFESYHRMLPECALRLRDAVCLSQISTQTEIFSENEILLVNDSSTIHHKCLSFIVE